jgi:tetratricopeptide (TPR) repeat protein
LALGPDHPDTLTSRNNLAAAYFTAGRVDTAIRLNEATLRDRESKLGPDHPGTLQSRHNLAVAYGAAGRAAEAVPLLESTLELRESKLGPDHPDTLNDRNNVAVAYWRAGRLDRSVPLFEQTLRQKIAVFGPDHPDTLRTQANLGINYRDAGRPAEGAQVIENALRRARRRPDTLVKVEWVRPILAAAYDDCGQLAKAELICRDLLERARNSYGPDDLRTAGAMATLGLNLLKQEKWSEAEVVLRDCLAVREKIQPDAWSTFNTRSQLGGVLLGQGRYAEAEPLIVQGYEGMKARAATIPAPGKDRLPEAALRVVRLYEAWGKAEQAKAWKARLGLADLPRDVFTPP